MDGKSFASLALALASTLVPAGHAQLAKEALLRLPLFPAPIVRDNVGLARALEEVGVEVQGGYALFGIEMRLKNGKEPTVNLQVQPGSTLGDALRQILAQLPDYEFEVVPEHLIDIYPRGARQERSDLLNIEVADFRVVNEHADYLLSQPQYFIPELRARLSPRREGPPQPSGVLGAGATGGARGVTLHLQHVTVRQILNAITQATEKFPADEPPLGWVYRFKPDPTSPVGGVHSWDSQWSAPRNWKQPAGQRGE